MAEPPPSGGGISPQTGSQKTGPTATQLLERKALFRSGAASAARREPNRHRTCGRTALKGSALGQKRTIVLQKTEKLTEQKTKPCVHQLRAGLLMVYSKGRLLKTTSQPTPGHPAAAATGWGRCFLFLRRLRCRIHFLRRLRCRDGICGTRGEHEVHTQDRYKDSRHYFSSPSRVNSRPNYRPWIESRPNKGCGRIASAVVLDSDLMKNGFFSHAS